MLYCAVRKLFYKNLRSSLSTESFLLVPLFSIVMRTIADLFSIVIGYKVEYRFLIEKFPI